MIEQNVSIGANTQAVWLIFSGEKLLQLAEKPGLTICSWDQLSFVHAYQEQIVQVGTYPPNTPQVESHTDMSLPCYLIDLGNENIEQQDVELISMRAFLMQNEATLFSIVARAWQVALFMRTHRFCGQCGSTMQQIDWEMAVQCSRCQHRCYPRISPCIIVSIRHQDKILLAQGKSQRSRNNMYSTLAGFVESGEMLEQAVHREVFEEVGIEVKNLRYFSSQPWPFPHSLMVGFLADFDSGDIQVDGKEILHADWFSIDNLPFVPPKLSIAGQLIEHTLAEIKQGKVLPVPA